MALIALCARRRLGVASDLSSHPTPTPPTEIQAAPTVAATRPGSVGWPKANIAGAARPACRLTRGNWTRRVDRCGLAYGTTLKSCPPQSPP